MPSRRCSSSPGGTARAEAVASSHMRRCSPPVPSPCRSTRTIEQRWGSTRHSASRWCRARPSMPEGDHSRSCTCDAHRRNRNATGQRSRPVSRICVGSYDPRMRARAAVSVLVLFSAIAASQPAAMSRVLLPTTLLVRVRDSLSGAPLPNAEVSAIGRKTLTGPKGEVRIVWPPEGVLFVRVRQLGFRYEQRTVQRGTSPTATEDTITIVMQRAAFALPQMTTVANARCRDERANNPTPLSASAMELLRFGAEQYGTFRRRYPFALMVERRTELFVSRYSAARNEKNEELTNSDEWGDRYFPGRVLQRTGEQDWFVPLLFVSALADSAFWARHCFVARGVEEHN